MNFVYDDGGRKAAGYKGDTGDCVCRAITIATGLPYQDVYDALNLAGKSERPRRGTRSNSRTGVQKPTIRKFMRDLGWLWIPCMQIGQGCKVHLCAEELPMGRLIVQVSRHLTAVIDGVIHDTHNPEREIAYFEPDHGQELKAGQGRNQNGVFTIRRRCVYGFWRQV